MFILKSFGQLGRFFLLKLMFSSIRKTFLRVMKRTFSGMKRTFSGMKRTFSGMEKTFIQGPRKRGYRGCPGTNWLLKIVT